jgi:hypothetical protein
VSAPVRLYQVLALSAFGFATYRWFDDSPLVAAGWTAVGLWYLYALRFGPDRIDEYAVDT